MAGPPIRFDPAWIPDAPPGGVPGPPRAPAAHAPDGGVPLTVDAGAEGADLRSLLRRGILVESRPGHYYLDEAAMARRRTGLPLVGAMLAVMAAAVLAVRALRR